jgi:hypothetical protein
MALVHFSKEAIFTHAHRSTARSDATSCSHQKEKEKAQHQTAGILFSLFFVFFLGSKGKRKRISKGKGKEKLGKYTDHRKGKGSKGKEPEDLGTEGPSMTGVTTASRWVAIRHSGQNTQP